MKNAPISDYLFWKAGNTNIPLSGTFELSPICNFHCSMCYVRKSPEEVQASERPAMGYNDWIRIAREAKEEGLLYLLLTGGEPLLWPDFWTLYDALIDMGILVSINSNGALIDEKVVRRFQKKPPTRINITLYGGGYDTYQKLCIAGDAFTKVRKGIELLTQAGISVKLNCSLTPQNACDLEEIVAYSKAMGLKLQIADYMFPPIRRDETMIGVNERFTPAEVARYRIKAYELQNGNSTCEKLLEQIREGKSMPLGMTDGCEDPVDGKIRCRAGKSSFWITWNGLMTPCGMMTRPYTDVREHSFKEAWRDTVANCREIKLTGICTECSNREICHPCAAMALAEEGEFSALPKYLCQVMAEIQQIARLRVQ